MPSQKKAIVTVAEREFELEGENLQSLIAGCIAVEAWEYVIEDTGNSLTNDYNTTVVNCTVQAPGYGKGKISDETILLNEHITISVIGETGLVMYSEVLDYLQYRDQQAEKYGKDLDVRVNKALDMMVAIGSADDFAEEEHRVQNYEEYGDDDMPTIVVPETSDFNDVLRVLDVMSREMEDEGDPLEDVVGFELRVAAHHDVVAIWYGDYDTKARRVLTEADMESNKQ